MDRRKFPHAPKRYADPKFGFTLNYPLVRHWTLEQTQPGFIMFANRFLKSTLAVMVVLMPQVIDDVHNLETQIDIVKGVVMIMRQMIPGTSGFKFGSSENIVNPHNGIKGFKLILHFKLPEKAMQGKYVTYVDQKIRYDLLATAEEQHYNTEDQIFFEPVIQSFTF